MAGYIPRRHTREWSLKRTRRRVASFIRPTPLSGQTITKTRAQKLLRWATVPEQSKPKSGGRYCAPFRGGTGFPSNTVWPGPRSISVPSGILIHLAVWPYQTWAKNWGLCPFLGEAGSPSNTMWPGLRPTSIPSGILIHPAVWPQ